MLLVCFFIAGSRIEDSLFFSHFAGGRSRTGSSGSNRVVSFSEREDEQLLTDDSSSHRKRTPLVRLSTRVSLNLEELSSNEIALKKSLYFHLSNPIKRWKLEKLVPTKLLLQLLKTVLFLLQVYSLLSYVVVYHLCCLNI